MEWPSNLPFSIKNDFWKNTSKIWDLKSLKVEATLAITFAIAEGNYQTAEDIAFSWIDTDHFYNKLRKGQIAEEYLKDYLKFIIQAIDRQIMHALQQLKNEKNQNK
jgi:RNAse (barnase) inhibitor barstar